MKYLLAVLMVLLFSLSILAADSLNVSDTIIPAWQPPNNPPDTTIKSLEGTMTLRGMTWKTHTMKIVMKVDGVQVGVITIKPNKQLSANQVWGVTLIPVFTKLDTTLTKW